MGDTVVSATSGVLASGFPGLDRGGNLCNWCGRTEGSLRDTRVSSSVTLLRQGTPTIQIFPGTLMMGEGKGGSYRESLS